MNLEKLTAYEIVQQRKIDDLNSEGVILRHKKTGARVTLLGNDDTNKVFYIGFRTPPKDSTGVAHIIEHSVLCGSDKYPVKDPFVELAKGSLNTFLNAMTYPDKTVYPVASCNDKDFDNLMDVYLDAVFHPNIYKEKKIFMQEGWHYECESADGPLTYNGVVYNEMKGAYSSADDLLDRETLNQLYPNTAYGVDSGGKPDNIPDLTYEDFIAFHQKYYHPSNSFIYLYGDMDMAEKLEYLDREYLSKYEFLDTKSEIDYQKPFENVKYITKEYPVLENDETENAAYFSYNVSIRTSLDKELYVALQILDYALCSAPGAPVKVALQNKGIGEDIYSICENGIYQPYFSFVAKNTKQEDRDVFVSTLEDTLQKLADDGISKNALYAALNYFEFKYKEADFGSYPKGLMYGLQALDSWLYDANAPFMHIEANETFQKLKGKIETDYFEQLVKKEILDNSHKAIIMMVPSKGLEKVNNDALAQKLETYKLSLTQEQLLQIMEDTKALKAYQEEEDTPEKLAKIPMLAREDLKKEAEGFINEERAFEDTRLLFHPIFTNGVSYLRMIFDVRDIDAQLLPYLSLLRNVLGLVNTEHFGYGELFNEMNLKTGGITFGVNSYTNARNLEEFKLCFEVKAKTLYENTDAALALIEEILFTSKLDDDRRLKDILGELKSRMQARMTSAGHSVAVSRAMSYISGAAFVEEQMSGVSFYEFITDLMSDFENKKEDCKKNMKDILSMILQRSRVFYDYTGTEEGLVKYEEAAKRFHAKLTQTDSMGEAFKVSLVAKNEGFCTSAGIQYVCRAGDFKNAGLSYNGALRVLKVMMGYDYLWIQVRVKGGAYGCMSNFSKSGLSYFVSYRDPNLEKTVDIYTKAPQYLRQFQADEDTMTKYIIGAIAEKDMPLGPNAKGSRSFTAYMTNYTFEEEQKERDEILHCCNEDIHLLAAYVEAMLADNVICAVGNEEKINQNKGMFGEIKPLF